MTGTLTTLSNGLEIVNTLLSNITNNKTDQDFINNNFKVTGSITKLLKTLVIEPTIIVTKDAYNDKAFDNVVNTDLDLFCSFYTQAFEILTSLNGKSAIEAINVLSTNNYKTKDQFRILAKNTMGYAKELNHLSIDTHEFVSNKNAMTLNQLDFSSPEFMGFNLEDNKDFKTANIQNNKDGVSAGGVVRTFNVKIKVNTETIVIPITVVANIRIIDVDELINVVTSNNYKKSLVYRWHEWRSGGITLKDLIFATDLIKEYKANRLKNKSTLLAELENKKLDLNTRKVLSGTIGSEASYNIIIITEDESELISKEMRTDITSYNGKEKFLSMLLGHNLNILNDSTERCKIYVTDIAGNIDIGYQKLGKKNDRELNLVDITRHIMANKAPSIY